MEDEFADFQLDEQQSALVFGGTHGSSAEDFPEDDVPPPNV